MFVSLNVLFCYKLIHGMQVPNQNIYLYKECSICKYLLGSGIKIWVRATTIAEKTLILAYNSFLYLYKVRFWRSDNLP